MSGQATGWVLRHGPHPDHIDREGKKYGQRAHGLRMVLVAVADAANRDGAHAHPGLAAVCEGALYSRRQAQRLLAELVAEGWLEVEAEGGGRMQATVYRVVLERVPSRHPSDGGKGAMAPPQRVPSEPETVPSGRHPNGIDNGSTSTESPPPAGGVGSEEARRIVQGYWDYCQREGRPTPTLSGSRGNPFMALVGVVETLLAAGYSVAHVKTALTVTQAYTVNSLTVALSRIGNARPVAPARRPPMQDRERPSGEVANL